MHESISVFIVDDEELARERLKRLIESFPEYRVVGEAENGDQALKGIPTCSPDIILLDIRMPGTDGLTVAQNITSMPQPPAIIFCTAYDDYAISAFKYNAIGYLLKPVRKEELLNALNSSQKLNQLQIKQAEAHIASSIPDTKNFVANTWQGQEIIPFDNIYFFKSDQKYLTVAHKNGETLSDQTLKDLEQNYPELLIRAHRNTLINKVYIASLIKDQEGHYHVQIKNTDHIVPVSRRHTADIKAFLAKM